MIIITNLCIGITYLFSIILIIDELYNIGFFTFNYTYQYNYGSFISKFNNVQTIECETNRFNVYNNINFIFKDIFNKSYFNYLLIIVATLITILCCIAYAVYFYFKFIIEQPQECSFDEATDLSLPKQLLKCLCDECHKLIPNCTTNYFIVFILLIIVPLSYIFKTMFNINFTPNTDNALFGFLYICVFLLLIFYYSFNLFNRKTEYKYKDLVVYSLFTLIFISSGYIYKYILNKYNNINLNSSNDISTIYDIYKQTPPIKPKPIEKPLYKGTDLITIFKYNEGDKDPDYKIKKSIVDDYHKSIKNYDNDMKNYNVRYNAYTNSLTSSKLGDKTNYFDIAINILGLKNYMHIYLIILMIISLVIYNIYNDDISYVCFIYVLTMLITLTIMNSILYYNTYINKYIIYEPMAHYKNDITNANTALNLELNPGSGVVFYNKLINNDKSLMTEPNSDIKDGKEILEDIKKLKDIKYYTSEYTSNINTDINTYNTSSYTPGDYDQIIDTAIFLYNTTNTVSSTKYDCTTKPSNQKQNADDALELANKLTKDKESARYEYDEAEQDKNIKYDSALNAQRIYHNTREELQELQELDNVINIYVNALNVYLEKKSKLAEATNKALEATQKANTLITALPEEQKAGNPCYAIYKNPVKYLLAELTYIKSAFNNNIKIETVKHLTFKYEKKDIIVNIPMTGYYKYCYYMLYQYQYYLENCIDTIFIYDEIVNTYKDLILNIIIKLDAYKEQDKTKHDNIIHNIKIQLDSYTDDSKITKLKNESNDYLLDKLDTFIKDNINNIKMEILRNSHKLLAVSSTFDNSYIKYLKVASNIISEDSINIAHNTKNQDKAISVNLAVNNYSDYLLYNDKSYTYTTPNFSLGDLLIDDNYFELPSKISDNNDEYTLTCKNEIITNNTIYLHYVIKQDNINNFEYNSKYITNKTITNKNIELITGKPNKYNLVDVDLTQYTIPFVLIKNNIKTTNIILFKKLILAVLFNSICNIQAKFESKNLFDKIKTPIAPIPEFQSNYINIMTYMLNFTTTFFTDTNKDEKQILLKTNDYISFYILLFNAYHSSFIDIKKTINTHINYLLNNYEKDNTTKINTIITNIVSNRLFSAENLNSDYSEFNKDDEIITLYKNNKPIINLIITLFENLLITIKAKINNSPTYTKLCSSSTSILTIQDTMNNIFGTITRSGENISKSLESESDSETTKLITELNNLLRSYFNIVIFLLDNLKLNTNTAEIDAITTNYNFYNRDDNIKSTIQKRLIISCDYKSKYNNMDSKQLSYFKINADNVNYNFPILMIIFLIILGEPIFIKS